MDLIKINPNIFCLTTIFILLNFISKILCLIEIPIKIINLKNVPKYKGIKFNPEIPPHIQSIINNYNNSLTTPKIFSESGDIDLISQYLLTIKIKIGSSNEEFNLILDTGSTITWVPLINSNDLYPIKNHYNPLNSSSSKKLDEDFIIKYGSGSCFGYYYQDKIIYINNKEFVFSFGAAEATDFNVDEADGIVGLSKLYEDKSKSFIYMLCKGGVTKSELFSFKLGLNLTLKDNGKFYIGKHDDFNKDNVATCELKNSNYFEKNLWACEMTSFSIVNSNKTITLTSEKKISVIFDSGTNVIFLPLQYLLEIIDDLKKLNCYEIRDYDAGKNSRYQIFCVGEPPDFNLVIDGHTFILPGKYMFYFNKNIALSKIMFQNSIEEENDVYIIGSPFFMLFHILFDSYSKELHFYPEKDEFLIKGSWWKTYHIIIVVISGILFILLICLIILLILYKRKNKLDSDTRESFETKSYFGFLL